MLKHQIIEAAVLAVAETFEIDWRKLQYKNNTSGCYTLPKCMVVGLLVKEFNRNPRDVHKYFKVYDVECANSDAFMKLREWVFTNPSIKRKWLAAQQLVQDMYHRSPDKFIRRKSKMIHI